MDWFGPYETALYSTGAVYLSILNLSPEQRYLPENQILVSLFPGGTAYLHDLDKLLKPLVDELLLLWAPAVSL